MPVPERKPHVSEPEETAATKVEIDAALAQYTEAVEHRLKPDLDSACERRDKYFGELAKLDQISKALDMLDAAEEEQQISENTEKTLEPIETRVNIGQEFYVRAVIDEVDQVIMDIGLGVMVEVSRNEARSIISARRELFTALSDAATNRITHVQAHLKSVMSSLSKLRAAASAVAIAEENRRDDD